METQRLTALAQTLIVLVTFLYQIQQMQQTLVILLLLQVQVWHVQMQLLDAML